MPDIALSPNPLKADKGNARREENKFGAPQCNSSLHNGEGGNRNTDIRAKGGTESGNTGCRRGPGRKNIIHEQNMPICRLGCARRGITYTRA